MTRFKNLTDSYKLSKVTWLCSNCNTSHLKLGKVKPKDRMCTKCKSNCFLKFDSEKELKHYFKLKLLEKAGEIKSIKTQVPFEFFINGKKIFTYRADFTYIKDDHLIVEDVKPRSKKAISPIFKLKKKLIEEYHQIKIEVIQ